MDVMCSFSRCSNGASEIKSAVMMAPTGGGVSENGERRPLLLNGGTGNGARNSAVEAKKLEEGRCDEG